MALLVGIDEAGYGPLLGPLVVGATVWRLPDEHVKTSLWRLLGKAVVRKPRRGEWRLHVHDSKLVFDRARGLVTLERPVLAFAGATGAPLGDLLSLITAVTGSAPADGVPWYGALHVPLPLAPETRFEHVAAKLGRVMDASGVQCRRLLAEVVTESHYNQRVSSTQNKSTLLIEQVLKLITRAARDAGDEMLVIRVDRLGGRTNYGDILRLAFPERRLQELELSDARSRYRLSGPGRDWFVEFAVDSDQQHLPVGLASMLAKYLREALMERFNAYWRTLLPDLRPTAGYRGDAQRFLKDIAPALPPSGLTAAQFVRLR